MSGGIDSSTNAALFSEGENSSVKTFCIGYDREYESYKNETEYAKMMASYCGAEYKERLLNQDDLFDFYLKWFACKMNQSQILYVFRFIMFQSWPGITE
ncbi:MAG: asparagine synthase-related protein [[Clostridium] symbiosum]